jgi:hypothetical protein
MRVGIYCYVWDFADEGVDNLLGWCAKTGITDLYIAATYHSGWFLHSHNKKHKTFMAESGAIYFQPERELYGRLQPFVASTCAEHDYFQEITAKAATYGLQVTAWTIGAHNTRMGLEHPDCCVTNCFGDSYPHALCTAHADVRQYLLALCREIGGRYGVSSLSLESFGYEGWKHGHQHERDFHSLTPLETELMSLCFNPATMAVAQEQGIDSEAVRSGVAKLLQNAFDSTPERPAGHPRDWEEAEAQIPGVTAYRDSMRKTDQLLMNEYSEAMLPAVCQNHTVQMLGAYGKDANYVREAAEAAHKTSTEQSLWVASLLGAEQVPSQEALTDIVYAAREGGAEGIVFYNYSESPRRLLDWLQVALKEALF